MNYFGSQELLEAVERERTFRFNPSRNATIFHHPTLGDFELQHVCNLPVLDGNFSLCSLLAINCILGDSTETCFHVVMFLCCIAVTCGCE